MAYIPNTLKEHRKRAGLRQRDVADVLGMKSTDRISRWEKGLVHPHLKFLLKMAAIYGVCIGKLFPIEE